jgi:peptidoglycan hydrolase-like protein with peptidoglycan-binding domain
MAGVVKMGSRGEDVTSLQNLLNGQGYGLSADGIFGAKTLAAVQDYQRNMGLTVDGIVGTNTWGALTGGGSGASGTGAAAGAVKQERG